MGTQKVRWSHLFRIGQKMGCFSKESRMYIMFGVILSLICFLALLLNIYDFFKYKYLPRWLIFISFIFTLATVITYVIYSYSFRGFLYALISSLGAPFILYIVCGGPTFLKNKKN